MRDQAGLGGFVQIGAELCESGQLPVLGEVEFQRARQPVSSLSPGPPADAGDRKPHVDRRADAREEQRRLEIDLAVGDRDDVGGDIGGNVAGLGIR